ncbi:hypothetical protein D3C84_287470 [compost metagenome]
MPGLPARATPVSRAPCSRLSTPAGKPASIQHFTVSSATLGVSSLGLKITALPASNAGTMWPLGRWPGKLYGPNTATTPWGLWRSTAVASARGPLFSPVRSR